MLDALLAVCPSSCILFWQSTHSSHRGPVNTIVSQVFKHHIYIIKLLYISTRPRVHLHLT